MALLDFNYEQTLYQVSQLQQIADDMRLLVNRTLAPAADNIAAIWKGEAAGKFLAHCATTRDGVGVMAKSLDDIAEALKQAAVQLREADEKAARLV